MFWLHGILETFNLSSVFEELKQSEESESDGHVKRRHNKRENDEPGNGSIQKLCTELAFKGLSIMLILSSLRLLFVDNIIFKEYSSLSR